jgi:hypothetical protein
MAPSEPLRSDRVLGHYAVKVVRAIRVVLLALLIAWGLIAVATMAGWDVLAVAE